MKYLSRKLIVITILFISSLFLSIHSSLASTQNSSQTAVIYGPSTNTTLQTGLVGWWTFDGADTTTSTAHDKSGQNNTATKYGVVPTGGKIGQGINFKPDLNTYGLNAGTNIASVRSASIWFKLNSCSRLSRLFQLGSNQYSPYVTTLCSLHVIYNGSDWTSPKVFSATELNKWMLFTSTFDGTVLKMYLNGSFVASTTMTTNDASAALVIGNIAPPGGGNQGWNGALDDLRLYTRVLSPVEVTALYKLGQNKMGSSQTAIPTTGNTLKTGLAGWWTMDGADVTANTTTDKAGTNNGTRSTTTLAVGKIGQAMKFNGTSSWINIGQAGLTLTDNFTLSAWIKTNNVNGNGRIIARRPVGSTQFDFYINGTSLSFYDGASQFDYGVRIVNDNKWHLSTVVINGSSSRFYVDGTRDGLVFSPTISTRVGNTNIGSIQDGAGLGNGLIDDVRIYNRALSATEITALYKLGQEKMGSSQTAIPTTGNNLKNGLVGWWTFDGPDTTANTSTDKSISGNNGLRTALTTVPGMMGQAFKFNGTSSQITVGNKSQLNFGTGNFSYASWVKPNGSNLSYSAIVSKYEAGAGQGYFVTLNGFIPRIFLNDALPTTANYLWSDCGTTGLVNNKWSHFVVTFQRSGNAVCYINGVSSGAVSISTENGSIDTAGRFVIGHEYPDDTYFRGSIDDVRMYNRVLSPAEVKQLYKMGK